jgi:hypothetical protein
MRGKAYCKKCFHDTEIQWCSWEGEMVLLGREAEMKEQLFRQQNYNFEFKVSFCGLNIFKLLS